MVEEGAASTGVAETGRFGTYYIVIGFMEDCIVMPCAHLNESIRNP